MANYTDNSYESYFSCITDVSLSKYSLNNPVNAFIVHKNRFFLLSTENKCCCSKTYTFKWQRKMFICLSVLIKSICISQVSKYGFRYIWSYCQNRHAISQYFEIKTSQNIELLCIYSQYLIILFFALPVLYSIESFIFYLFVFACTAGRVL